MKEYFTKKDLKKMDSEEKFKKFLKLLKRGTCEIEFTKVNGDKRCMVATLNPDEISPSEFELFEAYTEPSKKNITTSIPVIDVEESEWRSFRVDSVTNFFLV